MRAIAMLLAAACCATAQAQEVTLEPSAALRCLTPAADVRGTPEYPPDAWKRGQAGEVVVELIFTVPEGRPEVKVLRSTGPDELVDAVKAHVRAFRVPCLAGAEVPVRLRQTYSFVTDQRAVHWAHPVDQSDAERQTLLRCVKHESGKRGPEYPELARREGVQGRVLARLRFDAPDKPPHMEIFAPRAARMLASQVEEWVKGYRMPCHAGAPVAGVWTFMYFFQGERLYGFNDVTFRQFLMSIKDIDKQRLVFDLTTMACPFDVRLAYRQPHLPNAVGELGSQDPSRRPFLDWLALATLDLSRDNQAAVFGDSVTLPIPCLKIDLKPKE
jgi:hypothetical protein